VFRRILLTAVIAALVAIPGAWSGAAKQGPTTLDRSIVAEGEKDLGFGPGQERITRTLDWEDPSGRTRGIVAFKQLSDVHVIDEESPGRVEYFDACTANERGFSSAYRPHEAMSTQVGDSMLRRLGKITKGPETDAPFSFVISTGDNVDNNQLNETRWFIRLLDGDTVKPNSGAATYDGYRQDKYSEALPDEILELAQKKFDAVGTKEPWYAVLGNHDGLVQGNVPLNDSFQGLVLRPSKAMPNLDTYADCPTGYDDPNILNKVTNAFLCCSRPVPADPDRRFLTHEELIDEYLASSGKPAGHGFKKAPDDPMHGSRAGYYSFPIRRPVDIGPRRVVAIPDLVRGISLDTISYNNYARGNLPDPQFMWLEKQLKKWSTSYYEDGELVSNPKGQDRLIVLFSHHSSTTLNVPGEDPAGAPYHCFTEADADHCAGAEGLLSLIQRYPNVVAWVNGHEHNNRIRPYSAPAGADPALGFWEINTAAHIDWPQQARLIEIAYVAGKNGAEDTVLIYATTVDSSAPTDPDQGAQSLVQFLASTSRVEAYYDACVRPLQADCTALGAPEDINVKLVQKAPFDI